MPGLLAERVGLSLRDRACGFAAAPVEQGSHPRPTRQKNKKAHEGPFHFLAERVGFEPTVRETVHLISNQAHSTTLAPLLYTVAEAILGSKTSLVKYVKSFS